MATITFEPALSGGRGKMRVRGRLFWLLGGVLVAAACGGGHDVTAPPDPALAAVGTYTLVSVNGEPMPAKYNDYSWGTVKIASGTLALRSDRSFTETLVANTTYTDGSPPSTQNVIINGTYQVTGTQVTFTLPADVDGPAFSYTGAVGNGAVSYTYDGRSYEYRKQ